MTNQAKLEALFAKVHALAGSPVSRPFLADEIAEEPYQLSEDELAAQTSA